MSHEDLTTARDVAIGNKDVEALVALVTDDFQLTVKKTVYTGKQEYRDYLIEYFEQNDIVDATCERLETYPFEVSNDIMVNGRCVYTLIDTKLIMGEWSETRTLINDTWKVSKAEYTFYVLYPPGPP